MQKPISNKIVKLRRLTLQKYASTHKMPKKNCVLKKLGECKEESFTQRDYNTSKIKFKRHCNMNDLNDKKAKLEEVDSSGKA